MTMDEMIKLKNLLKKLRARQIKTLAEGAGIDNIETYSTDELYELDDYDNLIASIDNVLYNLEILLRPYPYFPDIE